MTRWSPAPLVVLLCLSLGGALHPATAVMQAPAGSTTVILVRHAERAPGEGDVPISAEGRARAEALARLLTDTEVQAVITSHLTRTRETAEPLARQQKLTPQSLAADKLEAVVERINGLSGSTILVVHHSNTVPVLVEMLGGRTPPIRDDEFDRVVIVTRPAQGAASVVTLRYGSPSQR